MTRRYKGANSLERIHPVIKGKPLLLKGFLSISAWVFYLWVFSPSLLGINPVRPLTQCRMAMWNQQNGLLQDSILGIAQTPDGFLWIASEEGLVRFDGAEFFVPGEFQQKPFLRRTAQCLWVDSAGELWMGSVAGVYCRAGKGRFRYFEGKDGVPRANISAIAADDQGTIWLGTYQGGLLRQSDDRFIEYSPAQGLRQQAIKRICCAKSGDLWVAASGGLYRLNKSNGTMRLIDAKDGLVGACTGAVTIDLLDRVWVATNQGLFCIEGNTVSPVRLPRSDNSEITALFTDSHGMIWVGSRVGGIWRFLPNPKIGEAEFRPLLSLTAGRKTTLVSAFCEDDEGDIWIGSGAGLFRISDTRFTLFNSNQGLPSDVVYSVLASQSGKIWIGTDTGLAFLTGPADAQAALVPLVSPVLSEQVAAMYEDARNVLWVGTANGSLQSFSEAPFSAESEPIRFGPGGQVSAICRTQSGDLLVGTGGSGLFRFHDGKLIQKFTEQDGIAANVVHAMVPGGDGTLWIAPGHGLLRYADGRLQDALPDDSPIRSRVVVSLLADSDGTLWAGTFGYGLARIRNGSSGKLCTTNDGLFSDEFFTLLKDDKENLWASSNRGIFTMPIEELNEFFDGKRSTVNCRRFTTVDGLVTAECTGGNANTSCRTSDGRLLFATVGGLAVASKETLTASPRAPRIALERLIANLTQYIPLRPGEPPTVLSPDIHSIEIHYAGLSLSAPENLQYRYKLEGFDPAWVDVGTRRVAYYTNLPPGDYRFRVSACNRDGIWPPEDVAAATKLVVQPHYYQTWWFYSLCLVLIGLAIWGLYRWRLAQILQERARLARDLHDTLAQGLVGILWQAERAINSERKKAGAETVQILEGMRTLARETLMEARGALRALRAGVLAESSSLTNALEKIVRKATSATKLKTDVRVQGRPFRVCSNWEQALVRITQEAIANSLKYANARRFEVVLQFEEKGLTLQLRDDGVGFVKAAENTGEVTATSSGLGIPGMEERCRALGGKLSIVSQAGKGTAIQVIAPASTCRRRWFW
jgi:ligand-binding sensor domain-containing protein/signal transduction histidine kinase